MSDDNDSPKIDEGKRKRNYTLTDLEMKIKALDALHNGISIPAVSKEIGVGESTIKHWKLKENELRDLWSEYSHEITLDNEIKKKRNNNSTPIETKIKVLDALKDGVSMSAISREIGVAESTIKHWKFKEKGLREWKSKHANARKGRKRIRRPLNGSTDLAIWIWYQEQQEIGAQVSGSLIKLQALRFWQLFEHKEAKTFNATQGWYTRWKERHGIKTISPNIDTTESTYHDEDFMQIIEGMRPEQVFCADELALRFRQLPKEALGKEADDEAANVKIQRERLTIMACTNATGTFKLPLMIIGDPSTTTGDLKNSTTLYKTQKNAAMTSVLFEEWFRGQFVPRVKHFLLAENLPRKAVLFLDNCDAHKTLVEDDFRVELLPGHITSAFQPMAHGCLQKVKSIYRLGFMNFLLERVKGGGIIEEVLRRITVQEAAFWLSVAWECVSKTTIKKAWAVLWPELMDSPINSHSELEIDPDKNQDDDKPNEQDKLSNEFCEALKHHTQNVISLNLSQVNAWLNPCKLWSEEECLTEEEIVQLVEVEEEEEVDEEEENIPRNSNDSSNPGPFLFVSSAPSGDESGETPVKKPLLDLAVDNEPSLKDILKALDEVINHINGNVHYTTQDLLALHSIRRRMIVELSNDNSNSSLQ